MSTAPLLFLEIDGDGGEDNTSLTDRVSVWPAEGISAVGGGDAEAAGRGEFGADGRGQMSSARRSTARSGAMSGVGTWLPNWRLRRVSEGEHKADFQGLNQTKAPPRCDFVREKRTGAASRGIGMR